MNNVLSPESVAQMAADREAGTPGPWASKAMGGSSTVLTDQMPSRNDTRIPAYGYREENGFCLSYPFIEDDGRTRLDFTCFSHADARRIARLPDLEAAYLTLAAELATLGASEAAALERVTRLETALKEIAAEKFYPMGIGIEATPTREAKMAALAMTPTADKE